MHDVSEDLRRFAFMQDEKGNVPLTPGKEYEVFGLRRNSFGDFVFVVRDGERLPWWMPKGFFEDKELTPLSYWRKEEYESAYGGQATDFAPDVYFENEEDIEDGTPRGHEAFATMQKLASGH